MGIPLFFRFITQKYPEIIKNYSLNDMNYSHLYFDFNGLIHPMCSKARKDYLESNKSDTINQDILYEKILENIIQQTNHIIELVKPSEYILLSVDGVAPLAKINQQRSRRYKSYIMNTMINRIKEKYEIPIDIWDTNQISPGTPFMNKLMNDLTKYIKKKSPELEREIELSCSNEPGEGEHKILKQIKELDNNKTKIIYGLDADLIMLSLSSGKNNIFLLRESIHFGKVEKDKFLTLDIDLLKTKLYDEISTFIINNQLSSDTIIRDYLFICFLLGNDFLPHSPSLHIGEGSIDYLLECYGNTMSEFKNNQSLIDDNNNINITIFKKLLENISYEEDMMVKSFYESYIRKKYGERNNLTEYEREIRRLDFMPSLKKTKDTIKLNKPDWQTRYYKRYLQTNNINEIEINKICFNYIEGLNWNINYYFSGCPSWTWFYKFSCAPTISDLYSYLSKNKVSLNTVWVKTKPLSTVEQLLCILPPYSVNLIPKEAQWLMTDITSPIRDLYPNSFYLEMIYMRYFHETIPKLPIIDYNRISKTVNNN